MLKFKAWDALNSDEAHADTMECVTAWAAAESFSLLESNAGRYCVVRLVYVRAIGDKELRRFRVKTHTHFVFDAEELE